MIYVSHPSYTFYVLANALMSEMDSYSPIPFRTRLLAFREKLLELIANNDEEYKSKIPILTLSSLNINVDDRYQHITNMMYRRWNPQLYACPIAELGNGIQLLSSPLRLTFTMRYEFVFPSHLALSDFITRSIEYWKLGKYVNYDIVTPVILPFTQFQDLGVDIVKLIQQSKQGAIVTFPATGQQVLVFPAPANFVLRFTSVNDESELWSGTGPKTYKGSIDLEGIAIVPGNILINAGKIITLDLTEVVDLLALPTSTLGAKHLLFSLRTKNNILVVEIPKPADNIHASQIEFVVYVDDEPIRAYTVDFLEESETSWKFKIQISDIYADKEKLITVYAKK